MNNKTSNNFITADCLITDLPAAAAFTQNVLTNGFSASDGTVIFNNQQRRRNNNNGNNSFNNGLRNMGRKKQLKQQQTATMDSISSMLTSTTTPLLFSSPSPPASPLSTSTEIMRPPRKPRKNKKSRAGTNPSRITPLSPSAISSCSLASFTSSSSGLSSGASSMGTLNDPDNINIHHSPISPDVVICPDNTVIKSSSSSAASSAGFGDMTSNDDEDFHERCNFYDEPILSSLDSMQFNRQWSLPNGMASEVCNNSYPSSSKPKNGKRKGNNNKFQSNYPKLTNPDLQQFYYEQHQFYRKIYDQQFAALSSIKLISTSSTQNIQKQPKLDRQLSESAKANVYIPHQHLGLPPLPPLSETTTPWLYNNIPSSATTETTNTIIPSKCEEAFLNHLKSHQIPKKQQQQQSAMMKSVAEVETPSIPASIPSPVLKTRADFHEQIRERLAASEKASGPSILTTPIKKLANTDKVKCSISDAAAIAGVSTPPAPLPQGRLSEDQSLFLQSLPLRLPFGTAQEPSKHFSTSYASVIQSTPPAAAAPKPTPLNALNLPPLPSHGYDPTTTTPKSSRHGSSSSSSKKSKKNRSFDNRLISTSSSTTSSTQCNNGINGGGGKRNNNHKNRNNIEFCMQDTDFPPISTLSTTSLSKDLSSSSQKGESGYQSEFSAQCSTADGETDSRCSDPVHRNYSSVVANGSKSCTDLSDSKEDSFTEDDCVSVPEDISRMDVLSEHICDYYERVTQTERTLLRKLRLRDMLYYSLAPLFPVCGLYVVGSSLNGFGNENSDMDLCLVITNGELDQRTHAVTVLSNVKDALASLSTIEEQTLITAKVPILRIKFRGPYSDIVVDLNANNLVAVRNTHLLCYYAFFDWRVRPLVTVIKEWAKQSQINDASRSTFTSYSLVLMVLHYLQVVDNPVLPSLQQHFPKRFNPKADIRTLNLSHPLEEISSGSNFARSNTSPLGHLLLGFFDYYANEYNYEQNAISIRLGREVQRADVVRHTTHWSPICIEEPFTRSNTAHSIYDEMIFKSIKQKFRDAHDILSKTSDLHSLLTIQEHQQ